MGARNGKQYIDGLRDDRHLFINGELVRDVTKFAPLQGGLKTLADLYEKQHDPKFSEALTTKSPTSGEPVSTSFVHAKTWEDMERRIRGERLRCELTYGLLGRLPDFMNAYVTDMAAARDYLGQRKPELGENTWRYYEMVREKDLSLTHTLIDPSIDRSKGLDAQEALRVVKETDAGVIVRGARMLATLAPLADELWVGSAYPRKAGQEDYAISFAVPIATPGLKLAAREPYDTARSSFDQPLTGRYDEGDALAVFEDVLVPWERVFAYRDLQCYNNMLVVCPGYLYLQAAIRGTVKLKLLAGLATLAARAGGRASMPRYQEIIGEVVASADIAEGLLNGVAVDVLYNANHPIGKEEPADERFDASTGLGTAIGSQFRKQLRSAMGLSAIRQYMPQALARAVDALRLIGSSSLIMTPTEGDFSRPELGEILQRHMRSADATARERVRLSRIIWDMIGTQFGGRQFMYEIFYSGDPISAKSSYFMWERTDECAALAEDLVASLKNDE
jgi:aromatic ring hydroxylase